MVEEFHHTDGPIDHPSVRYERSDARLKPILVILLIVMGIASFHFYMVWRFFNHYEGYQAAIKKSPFPLAPTPSEALPPEPRLEPIDRMANVQRSNVYERQVAKEDVLKSYGPTTEDGFIRIPIDRAMTLLEDKPPHRKELPANEKRRDAGLMDAGASNSGRMFRGQPRWYEH
jgi:hypothetical protein